MPRAYSKDLRERVVAAVERGERCRAVPDRFGVAVSSVVKWSQRFRATGSVESDKIGGYRRQIMEPHRASIAERIAQTSHLTLHGLQDELAASGVSVSYDTIWRFLRSRGLSLKKTLFALERSRAEIVGKRRRWKALQGRIDPRRLVFIDETWIKTNMTPLRGWGPNGKRLHGFAPHGRWRAQKFLAALRWDCLTAPCVFDGPINGACFRAYVDQFLLPTLQSGDIVIKDNLGRHKAKTIGQAIRAADVRL